MIGFVDYDLLIDTRLSIPNLELLKMASYYKTEDKQFCRLLSLEEKELSAYDKIYFFCEKRECEIPKTFLAAKNVDFRGLHFTKGTYVPFENELMEFMIPRTDIYKNYLRKSYQDGFRAKDINHFLDDSYYRAYANEVRLPFPPMIPRKRLFLYDVDFFYNDWKDILNEAINRRPSSIIRVNPIVCKKVSDYFDLRGYDRVAKTTDIYLDIPIPLNETHVLFNRFGRKFLGDINISSNVFIPFGGDLPTKIAYQRDFLYKINLLYCFWAKGIPIKLKFLPPSIGVKNPIQELSESVANWGSISTKKKMETSFIERLPKKNKKTPQPVWLQFEDFKKYSSEIEPLLSKSYESLRKEKVWRP